MERDGMPINFAGLQLQVAKLHDEMRALKDHGTASDVSRVSIQFISGMEESVITKGILTEDPWPWLWLADSSVKDVWHACAWLRVNVWWVAEFTCMLPVVCRIFFCLTYTEFDFSVFVNSIRGIWAESVDLPLPGLTFSGTNCGVIHFHQSFFISEQKPSRGTTGWMSESQGFGQSWRPMY